MLNLSDLQTALVNPNISEVLKAVTDLRERIEVVHTPEFGFFLQNIFPLLCDIVSVRTQAQFYENDENKCRHTVMEIFNRLPSAEALKPYVFKLLNICMKVLSEDNEENALTALRIIFDLHKSYRPSLESQVQPFLELVQKIFKNVRLSVSSIFVVPGQASGRSNPALPSFPGTDKAAGTSSSNFSLMQSDLSDAVLFGSHGSAPMEISDNQAGLGAPPGAPLLVPRDQRSVSSIPVPHGAPMLLKSLESFKVLTECPLIVMLLFQLYPKFINVNIPQMLPVMMEVLALQVPSEAAKLHRSRFREFQAAQVKTLSFMTYLLRGFSDNMKPYEDTIARNILALLHSSCPAESVSTRKELLVAIRHILATDFRKGFFSQIDSFLDENLLIGPSRLSPDALRPMAILTVADLVQHTKEILTYAQLSKVVFLFARNVHDSRLPASIHTSSVRLLASLADMFNNSETKFVQNTTFKEEKRMILTRILRTFVYKIRNLRSYIRKVEAYEMSNRAKEQECFESISGNGCIIEDLSQLIGSPEYLAREDYLVKKQEFIHGSSSSPVPTVEISPSPPIVKNRLSGASVLLSKTIMNSGLSTQQDNIKDVKQLVKILLSGVKTVLTYITKCEEATEKNTERAQRMNIRYTDEECDLMRKYVKWSLQCIQQLYFASARLSQVDCDGSASCEHLEVKKTTDSSVRTANIQENDLELKDMSVNLANSLSGTDANIIRKILGPNIDLLFKIAETNELFLSVLHQLFHTATGVSQVTWDIVLAYLICKLDDLAHPPSSVSSSSADALTNEPSTSDPPDKGKQSALMLRVIKIMSKSISFHPDNEKILRSRLSLFIKYCLILAHESRLSINYMGVLRTIFRAVSDTKSEASYKEVASNLPVLYGGLMMLMDRTEQNTLHNVILELILIIPSKLESLLPHLPFLLRICCRAIRRVGGDKNDISILPGLALRTLDYWIENWTLDYVYPVLEAQPGLLSEMMSGICLHLKPAPYPHGTVAVRVLGKLGGRNKHFLREIFPAHADYSDIDDAVVEKFLHAHSGEHVASILLARIDEASDSGPLPLDISLDESVRGACRVLEHLPALPTFEAEVVSLSYEPAKLKERSYSLKNADEINLSLQQSIEAILGTGGDHRVEEMLCSTATDNFATRSAERYARECDFVTEHVALNRKKDAFQITSRSLNRIMTLYQPQTDLHMQQSVQLGLVAECLFALLCSSADSYLEEESKIYLKEFCHFASHLCGNDAMSSCPKLWGVVNDVIVRAAGDARPALCKAAMWLLTTWIHALAVVYDVDVAANESIALTCENCFGLSDIVIKACSTVYEVKLSTRYASLRIIHALLDLLRPGWCATKSLLICEAIFVLIRGAAADCHILVLEDMLPTVSRVIAPFDDQSMEPLVSSLVKRIFGTEVMERFCAKVLLREIEKSYSGDLRALYKDTAQIIPMHIVLEPLENISHNTMMGFLSGISFLLRQPFSCIDVPPNLLSFATEIIKETTKCGVPLKRSPRVPSPVASRIAKIISSSPLYRSTNNEDFVDLTSMHFPLGLPATVELRLHVINFLHGLHEHSDILLSEEHSSFRRQCMALLFNSLTISWEEIIVRSHTAISSIEACFRKKYPDAKSDSFLPKDILQECLTPLFRTVSDYKRLGIAVVKGLGCMLQIVTNKFYSEFVQTFMRHLKYWTDPDRIMSSQIWAAGEEQFIAAGMMDLFHLLPWEMSGEASRNTPESSTTVPPGTTVLSRFVSEFATITVELERVRHKYRFPVVVDSPYLIPFAKFISRFANEAVQVLVDPSVLCKTEISYLLLEIMRSAPTLKHLELFLRQLASKSGSDMLVRNVLSPLHAMHGQSGSASSTLLVDLEPQQKRMRLENGSPVFYSSPNTMLFDTSRLFISSEATVSLNSLLIIRQLSILHPPFLEEHPEMVEALRSLLSEYVSERHNSAGRESGHHTPYGEIEVQCQRHEFLRLLCEIFLTFCRSCPADISVLFDLIMVLQSPTSVDYTFLVDFFKSELPRIFTSSRKQQLIREFLVLYANHSISAEQKVITLQVMIIPLLLHTFNELEASEAADIIDNSTLKMIMQELFSSGTSTGGVDTGDHFGDVEHYHTDKSHGSMVEPLNVELLQIATFLIEHCNVQLVDHRKDLIKFAWNHLKAEDVSTKYWAYVNVCRFIAAYDTPPKIILQVYVALLRTYQADFKDLVQLALDTLIPALPTRLTKTDDFVKAMKWTKKIVFEEGHSLPQLAHIWHLIIRHAVTFYPYRSHFVPQMVSSISRLGLHTNCALEHRQVALGCAEVLIGWEWVRTQKKSAALDDIEGHRMEIEDITSRTRSGSADSKQLRDDFVLQQNMVQMLANFLVRLGLFVADSKERALHRMSPRCVDLFRRLACVVSLKNVKISYFERLLQTFFENYANNSTASAKSGQKSGTQSSKSNEEDPRNRSSGNKSAAAGVSDRILNTFLQFLVVSFSAPDCSCALFLQHVTLVKDLLHPVLHNENPKMHALFRKFMLKVMTLYPPTMPPTVLVEKGFYQKLKDLVDSIIRKDASSSLPASNTKSSSDESRLHEYKCSSFCCLLLLDDIGRINPSWLENHGAGLVVLCQRLLNDHLSKVSVEKKSGLEAMMEHSQSIQPAHKVYATPQLVLTAEHMRWQHSSTGVNMHLDDTVSALVLCLNIFSNAVERNCLKEHKSWLLSVYASIIEGSTNPVLLGVVVENLSRWIAQPGSPFSAKEQCTIFAKLHSFERVPEGSLQCIHIRVAAIIERVAMIAGANLSGLHKLFGSSSPTSLAMNSFGMMCCYQPLQNMSIRRLMTTVPHDGMLARLTALFDMDFSCLSSRFWPCIIPYIILNASKVSANKSYSIETASWNDSATAYVARISNTSADLQEIVASIQRIAPSSPDTGNALLIGTLQQLWKNSTDDQRKTLSNSLAYNIARHSYIRKLSWSVLSMEPGHLSPVVHHQPRSVPQFLLQEFFQLSPRPDLPVEFLGAVSNAYGLWHHVCQVMEALDDGAKEQLSEMSARIWIKLCRDVGDMDTVTALYNRFSAYATTKQALSYDRYGLYDKAQESLFSCMQSLDDLNNEEMGKYGALEVEIWEERWIDSARHLSQWQVLSNYAKKVDLADIGIEAAVARSDFAMVKHLHSSPMVLAHLERGCPEYRIIDAMMCVADKNFGDAEKINAQVVHMSLLKWEALPALMGGCDSQAHKDLLHMFHRSVELKESCRMLQEAMSKASKDKLDFKSNLQTWRDRIPNSADTLQNWDSIMQWRAFVFHTIKSIYQQYTTDEMALASVNDTPWTIITLAHAARKRDFPDVALRTLSVLNSTTSMEVCDAYSKIREQVLICLSSAAEVRSGLSIINSTNLEYFDPPQKAELFRLKAIFQSRMSMSRDAQQSFSQCVQVCPAYAKGWMSWGQFCYTNYVAEISPIENASSTVVCILKAVECNLEVARLLISRVLWLIAFTDDGPQSFATILRLLASRLPEWIWLPHLPLLICALDRREAPFLVDFLCSVAEKYPQAMMSQIALALECYKGENIRNYLSRILHRIRQKNSLLFEHTQKLHKNFDLAFNSHSMLFECIFTWINRISKRVLDTTQLHKSDAAPPPLLAEIGGFIAETEQLLSTATPHQIGASENIVRQLVVVLKEILAEKSATFDKVYMKLLFAKTMCQNHFICMLLKKNICPHSFLHWSCVGEAIGNPKHTIDETNRDCGIELPGNYVKRFTEPKTHLYPHFVRLLPRVRLGMLGDRCGLRVEVLCSDGRTYPIHVERRLPSQIDLSCNAAKIWQNHLYGVVDWVLGQNYQTRNRDLSISSSPSMFVSPQLQLHLLPERDLQTLEELKLRQLVNDDFTSADVNSFALREEYEKFAVSSHVNALQHVYNAGNQIIPENVVANAVRAVKHSKERYFYVRRIAASQFGVNGAVSTLVGSISSAACDIAVSPFTGRIEQMALDPNLDVTLDDVSHSEVLVPPPIRLTKNIVQFLSHLQIEGTMRTTLGATLRALEENKDIMESFLLHHMLSLVEHQGKMTDPSVKFRTVRDYVRRLMISLERLAPAKESGDHTPDCCVDSRVADILHRAASEEIHKTMHISWEAWY